MTTESKPAAPSSSKSASRKSALPHAAVVIPEGLTIYEEGSEKQTYVLDDIVQTYVVPSWVEYLNAFVAEVDAALRAANPDALPRKLKVYDPSSAISVLLENLERVSPGYAEFLKPGKNVEPSRHAFFAASKNPFPILDGHGIYEGPPKQLSLSLSEIAHAQTLPRLEAYLNAHGAAVDAKAREEAPLRPQRKLRVFTKMSALNELLKNLSRVHLGYAEYEHTRKVSLDKPPFGAVGKRKTR